MKVTVVVGNPKPRSRTAEAATALAHDLAGEQEVDLQLIDVVDVGAKLLGWGDAEAAALVERVAGSDLVVVASPTFKATYSGLLKLFLDQFDTGTGLRDVVAVPLMLGAGPAHLLAPELLLKPVLVELGATCPTPGLYLLDKSFHNSEQREAWLERWAPVVRKAIR